MSNFLSKYYTCCSFENHLTRNKPHFIYKPSILQIGDSHEVFLQTQLKIGKTVIFQFLNFNYKPL